MGAVIVVTSTAPIADDFDIRFNFNSHVMVNKISIRAATSRYVKIRNFSDKVIFVLF